MTEAQTDHSSAAFEKGSAYKDMGLHKEAIAEFEKCLSDEAMKYRAIREISSSLVKLNMPDKAEKLLLQALCSSCIPEGDRFWIYYDLADLYMHAGKVESALERLMQIDGYGAQIIPGLPEKVLGLSDRLGGSLPEGGLSGTLEGLGSKPEAVEVSHAGAPAEGKVSTSSDPRRRAPRVKFSGPVQYSFDQIRWSTGYFSDLSTMGAFVLTHEPIPIGSLVFLKLDLPSPANQGSVDIIGQAVRQDNRCQNGQGVLGMGIQFISMEEEQKSEIRCLVETIQADETLGLRSPQQIRFHCDHCGRINSAPESAAGRPAKCQCGKIANVPYARHTPSAENSLRGALIAGCRIDSTIGKGSVATVFKGHHLTLDIPVAIKILDPTRRPPGSLPAQRFLKEAQVIARLKHPNIVGVMNAGQESQHSFIIMQYVAGKSLGDSIRNRDQLTLSGIVRVFLDVCNALCAAHQHSIVHRDIKPDNILLTAGGRALLTDFGLVMDLGELQLAGEQGLAVGTPLYISPEQIRGAANVDYRADIYSLGATMYHTLAGIPPFKGSTPLEVFARHLREPLIPLSAVAPHIPSAISDIVDRAMEKNPRNRFQSMEQMKQELLRLSARIAMERFRPIDKKLLRIAPKVT